MSKTKNIIDKEEKPVEIKPATVEEKEIYAPKSKKQLLDEKLKPYIEEETKVVKGRFRNFETPGGGAHIHVSKYPGIAPFSKVMQDGEMYEIPLYVARFLNGVDITAKACDEKIHTCSYPIHGFKWDKDKPSPSSGDEAGIPVPIVGITKRVKRYGFES